MGRPVFVEGSLREARLQVCEACPRYRENKIEVLRTCSVCNCLMYAKTWIARIGEEVVDCPEGRWSDIR
jgi:hypothetical protein